MALSNLSLSVMSSSIGLRLPEDPPEDGRGGYN